MAHKDEDLDAAAARKFRARCKFRMLGGLVLENLGWMSESVIKEPARRKTLVGSLLETLLFTKKLITLEDKYLLISDNTWRSSEEQRYLYRILGRLKCFQRYPKSVRYHLSSVAGFKYFGPNRVLARRDREAQAMYYIVSGDVELITKVYDAYNKTWNDGFHSLLQHGNEFGQEELLYDQVRPFTYKSITPVEMIYITKEDFKNVLETNLRGFWEDIKRAMSQFTYFSSLSRQAILEACLTAKIKTYKENETLLGDKKGFPTFVYFILSGTCQLVDLICVQETKQMRKTTYSLYTPKKELTLDDNVQEDLSAKVMESFERRNTETTVFEYGNSAAESRPTARTAMFISLKYEEDPSIVSNVSSVSIKKFDESNRESFTSHITPLCSLPNNVKAHFMQVCLMNPGGCFGWEDSMEDRRMVAKTNVKCLLLPKTWLWKWNTHSIWNQIKHYYDTKIPSKNEVFKYFALDKKWDAYKEDVVHEIIKNKKSVNYTRREDVAYSVIIKENRNLIEDFNF